MRHVADWVPDIRGDEDDPNLSAISQAVGSASMLWKDAPQGSLVFKGIFDSEEALRIIEGLYQFLYGHKPQYTIDRIIMEARVEKKYRDAGTGKYVTQEYAEAHPATTVSEEDPSGDITETDDQQLDDSGAGSQRDS